MKKETLVPEEINLNIIKRVLIRPALSVYLIVTHI